MEERYWQLGNAITGFTVLQAIAFLYALSDPAKVAPISDAVQRGVIALASIAACAFYVAGVWLCWYAASLFEPDPPFMRAYALLALAQTFLITFNTIGVAIVAKHIVAAILKNKAVSHQPHQCVE
jgi:hypothetical protein